MTYNKTYNYEEAGQGLAEVSDNAHAEVKSGLKTT